MTIELKYFSSVFGKAVPRFGTDGWIGAIRKKDGFIWDESEITAVPMTEYRRYLREYTRVLKEGSILERTKKDRDGWISETESKYEPKSDSNENEIKERSEFKPLPRRKRTKKQGG